ATRRNACGLEQLVDDALGQFDGRRSRRIGRGESDANCTAIATACCTCQFVSHIHRFLYLLCGAHIAGFERFEGAKKLRVRLSPRYLEAIPMEADDLQAAYDAFVTARERFGEQTHAMVRGDSSDFQLLELLLSEFNAAAHHFWVVASSMVAAKKGS